MVDRGRPFEREIIEQDRESHEQREQRDAAADPMRPRERDRSSPCAGATHQDDVQLTRTPTIIDGAPTKPPMPKSPPYSPIARIFERDPQIASWTDRLRREAALTAVVRRVVPRALAGRVRVTCA